MRRKWIVAAAVPSLALSLAGCATAPKTPVNTVKEFSFAGGQFKDGKITVTRDFKVEKDPGGSRKVMLRRATGPGLEFNCSCILEAGGSCFPVVQDDGTGPIILMCGDSGCGTGDEPFCLQEIGEEGGFRFNAVVAATRVATPQ